MNGFQGIPSCLKYWSRSLGFLSAKFQWIWNFNLNTIRNSVKFLGILAKWVEKLRAPGGGWAFCAFLGVTWSRCRVFGKKNVLRFFWRKNYFLLHQKKGKIWQKNGRTWWNFDISWYCLTSNCKMWNHFNVWGVSNEAVLGIRFRPGCQEEMDGLDFFDFKMRKWKMEMMFYAYLQHVWHEFLHVGVDDVDAVDDDYHSIHPCHGNLLHSVEVSTLQLFHNIPWSFNEETNHVYPSCFDGSSSTYLKQTFSASGWTIQPRPLVPNNKLWAVKSSIFFGSRSLWWRQTIQNNM